MLTPNDPAVARMFQPVYNRIWTHTVQFLMCDSDVPLSRRLGAPRGMGTLVEANGPCILTANHVWSILRGRPKLKPPDEKRAVGVFFEEGQKAREFLTALITPRAWPEPKNGTWNEREDWSEWGPDLALLRIPEIEATFLRTKGRSFFRLDKVRPSSEATPWWAVMGVPLETVPRSTPEGLNLGVSLFPSPHATYVNPEPANDFDYVELAAPPGVAGRPQSYGGVSGAGLWRFGMRIDGNSLVWDENLSLEGVAFYELPGTGVIRCHGPRSIERTRALSANAPSKIPLLSF